MTLPPETAEQIDALNIDPDRPLIISDADEVLFQFATGLEHFLADHDLYFDISSFALTGNIRRKEDDEAVTPDDVRGLLERFFKERTEHLPPVPGAAQALEALSARSQVVVLTNIPVDQREARVKGLRKHSMDYPVVANSGLKGPAVHHLTRHMNAPSLFLDDIPYNISSVAKQAAHVHRIHFVADARLARLIDPAEDSHSRIDDWDTAHTYIDTHLTKAGY